MITRKAIKEAIDWQSLVGDWYEPFEDLLTSDMMKRLLLILYQEYHSKHIIYPEKPKTIFRAFKECQYKDLRVVILGQDPYPDGSYTGIPFANEGREPSKYSPSLKKMAERIKTDFNTEIDPTLASWTSQGVLILNASMTVRKGEVGSHAVIWSEFMNEFFKRLNSLKANIFYCFWGNKAKIFSEKICKSRNFLLYCSHPAFACYKKIPWTCGHFKAINKKLSRLNEKEIKW